MSRVAVVGAGIAGMAAAHYPSRRREAWLFEREPRLGGLLADPVNWAAAIVFYLLFLAGIVFSVTLPAARAGSLARALATGAFFGLVAYATYDLTNLATLKGWPIGVTVVDICWGMVLTASVAAAGYAVAR